MTEWAQQLLSEAENSPVIIWTIKELYSFYICLTLVLLISKYTNWNIEESHWIICIFSSAIFQDTFIHIYFLKYLQSLKNSSGGVWNVLVFDYRVFCTPIYDKFHSWSAKIAASDLVLILHPLHCNVPSLHIYFTGCKSVLMWTRHLVNITLCSSTVYLVWHCANEVSGGGFGAEW